MKRTIIVLLFFCLTFFNVFAAEVAKEPKAFLPETEYEFEPVPEGTMVEKVFTIMNRGSVPLFINNIVTGCGCTTANYSKVIMPDGTGTIEIKVSTDYEGGNSVAHNIKISTNEQGNEKLKIKVFGKVKKIYNITPQRIRLVGPPNQEISQTIKVTPEAEYPFKIKKVTVKTGKNVVAYLDENFRKETLATKEGEKIDWEKEMGPQSYYIVVKNLSKKEGRYYDKLVIETDSEIKPTIELRVWGNIFARTEEKR